MSSVPSRPLIVEEATPLSARWSGHWDLVVVGAVLALVYSGVVVKLVHDWLTIPDFSHGLFLPLVSAYLLWTRRDELSRICPKPSSVGFAIVLFACALLFLGVLGSDLFLTRVSFLLAIAGSVIFLHGWLYFKKVLFPWALLWLGIPIPAIVFNQLTLPLQFQASRLATYFLDVIGVPVLRQGNVIILAALPLEVAEACSGIRSLMSLITLAVVYGIFVHISPLRRIGLVALSIPIAILANAFRIVGTGLCAQYWDPVKATGFFHEFSGWLIFLVSTVLLVGCDRLINTLSNRRLVPNT
jgi:exosortase